MKKSTESNPDTNVESAKANEETKSATAVDDLVNAETKDAKRDAANEKE